MCYSFDDIFNCSKINVSNILLDKKLYENISVYNSSYKTSTGSKPFCIRCHKTDGFIMVLDGKIKHLILFDYGLYEKILIRLNSGIAIGINDNFGRIRINSYNSISIKKILTF